MKISRGTRFVVVSVLAVPYLATAGLANDAPIVVERAKLIASDGTALDGLGWVTRIDGDRVVIGTHGAEAAYTFVSGPSGWVEEQILTASDGFMGQYFGQAADLDGDTLVIGAQQDNEHGLRSGAAYVFDWDGSSWSEQQKLALPGSQPDHSFGYSVCLDGDTLAISSIGDDPESVHVFLRSGTTWTHQAELVRELPGGSGDSFGHRLDLDGDTLVVGAPWDTSTGFTGGAAYVFQRIGTTWTQQARLLYEDTLDEFGRSVAIHGDTIVVGAPGRDAEGPGRGAAYVYVRSGTSWSQEVKLMASDATDLDRFGHSVTVQGDIAYIGAIGDQASTGAVYRFARTGAAWTETNKVLAVYTPHNSSIGCSIDLDGNRLAVGAYLSHAGVPDRAGVGYVFEEMTGEPGVALCFGDGSGAACPCGNDSAVPGTGCLHSGGVGMRIIGAGSTSISADDLALAACDCPMNNTGIFIVGRTSPVPATTLYDGLFCIGGSSLRFRGIHQQTGTASHTGFVAEDWVGGYFQPGLDYYFQFWSRDVARGGSPCGTLANLSPAYRVTMTP